MHEYLNQCLAGAVVPAQGDGRPVDSLDWNPHPAFSGVDMKHLVTGADTDGAMSLHLVRIAPDCAIGEHAHDTQWELHQVVDGSGECFLEGCGAQYAPGVTRTLPPGKAHDVRAREDGLVLLAVFAPALT